MQIRASLTSGRSVQVHAVHAPSLVETCPCREIHRQCCDSILRRQRDGGELWMIHNDPHAQGLLCRSVQVQENCNHDGRLPCKSVHLVCLGVPVQIRAQRPFAFSVQLLAVQEKARESNP